MKIMKGEDIRYSVDNTNGGSGYTIGYVISITGIIMILSCVIGIINVYIRDNSVATDAIAMLILTFIISAIFLYFGLKRILRLKRIINKVRFLKRNGLKAQGTIKKLYVFSAKKDIDRSYERYYFYQLKIAYFNKNTNKTELFFTPTISGRSDNICSDKVDVYYKDDEATIDNLIFGDFSVEFEEGVFEGIPECDNEECEKLFQDMEIMDINEFNKARKKLKMIRKNRNKAKF